MSTPESRDKQLSDKLSETLARGFGRLENPFRLRQVILGLSAFCALLFIIDLFHHRHAYFGFESSRGFYPIVGFLAFACIVILAGQLRRLIKRPENYYGSRSTAAEDYPEVDLQRQTSQSWQAAASEQSASTQAVPSQDIEMSSKEEANK